MAKTNWAQACQSSSIPSGPAWLRYTEMVSLGESELPDGKRSIRLGEFSDFAGEKSAIVRKNTPRMPAAIKLWADYFPVELTPPLESPMNDPEFLNIVTQIRDVFGGESFVWETGEGVSGIQKVWWHETHGLKRI